MITVLSSQSNKLTPSESGQDNTQLNAYAGLHDDEKPTDNLATGSIFIEVDTGDVYLFNEETPAWVKQYSLQSSGVTVWSLMTF